ncbi:tonB-system energizer ExbB [Altererythrobacter aerius]|uniref:Biopolymer transport protein ExbB n=1 Tax=Tsuneonella aeria TaxID=1837929 RepID=A0A6I4TEL3_9SPHN|nr:tonB-system energizer ExbB [Tsuneonella aeria]MXO76009.1 tonB-system energizer ExbB [Tsuneonella aeria]
MKVSFRVPLFLAGAALSQPAFAQGGGARPVPTNLSVGEMFLGADWVVKLVMIGLLVASIATWTVFVAKHRELRQARAAAEEARDQLAAARTLADLPAGLRTSPLVRQAFEEIEHSADALGDRDGIKERLVSRLDRFEAELARRMTRGVTILATIGAIAPFVGLFGTVWGIMNSFIGIAEEQTTNLAVVAPGIAEALLATALGLVAAIPAVVFYNHFARAIAAHRAVVADSAAALLRLVSRDLSRGRLSREPA